LLNWASAAAGLAQDGAFRFGTFLEQIGEPPKTFSLRSRRQVKEAGRYNRALQLGAVSVIAAFLAAATHHSFAIGANLFTAQVIVAVMAVTVLFFGSPSPGRSQV